MTELKDKAIDIKWKKYVLVSDRVLYFNENYPNGCIQTVRETVGDKEIIKAVVCPDCDKPSRIFTWYSQATWGDGFINKTSALENAETSAVGRALAFMWIWVIDSIASVDEINKAENTAKSQTKKTTYQSRFQKAMSNTEFMKQCLDQNDFINKIKDKYELDEFQESQLRTAYQNATAEENLDLPFGNE